MPKNTRTYIPALGHDWLTVLYDPILHLLLREGTWKQALLNQVGATGGGHILDLPVLC